MSIQEYNFPIFFNSSPEAGAVPIGILGNEFSVQLNNPIVVPRNAINCTVEISSACLHLELKPEYCGLYRQQ